MFGRRSSSFHINETMQFPVTYVGIALLIDIGIVEEVL
jgi:hypothetical protein